MTEQEAKTLIAAVTSTLVEIDPDGTGTPVPASQVYLALGMDMSKYEMLSRILRGAGLAVITAETIALTMKGRELGKACNAILADAKR